MMAKELESALLDFSRRLTQASASLESDFSRLFRVPSVTDSASEPEPASVLDPVPADWPAAEKGPEEPEPEHDGETSSLLMVGKAETNPGGTVDVDVLGSTHIPVNGFGISVGAPKGVSIFSVETTGELGNLLGIDDPQLVVNYHRGKTWRDRFLQAQVMFFGTALSQVQIEGKDTPPVKPKRNIIDARIPAMTPLLRLRILVDEDARKGRYALDPALNYAVKIEYSTRKPIWIRMPTEFTTSASVQRLPVRPEIVSGWVDVV